MENLLGGSVLGFLGLTLALFAGASWMMGQALALTWRAAWQIVPYAAMLAATDRFLAFALFSNDRAASFLGIGVGLNFVEFLIRKEAAV